MDQDISPGKILLRLEELRKWQRIQEERLLEQQMIQRKNLEEASKLEAAKLYEAFSNNSSFQNTVDSSTLNSSDSFSNCNLPSERDKRRSKLENLSILMDGVSALNISKESEPLLSPILSVTSAQSNYSESNGESYVQPINKQVTNLIISNNEDKPTSKNNRKFPKPKTMTNFKQNTALNIDDIPINTKVKDFETLVKDKVDNNTEIAEDKRKKTVEKKPFLKRGQGMSRFNMTQRDIGLKNKIMPWRKQLKDKGKIMTDIVKSVKTHNQKDNLNNVVDKIHASAGNLAESSKTSTVNNNSGFNRKSIENSALVKTDQTEVVYEDDVEESLDESSHELSEDLLELLKSKQPWISVLNQEQEKYIRLLGQSDKYKHCFNDDLNSDSSIMSSPTVQKFKERKEMAEQRIFEMLESKVDSSSYSSNCSFIQKVIDMKGSDTPTLNKAYVKAFPHILNLKPQLSDVRLVESLDSTRESSAENTAHECTEHCQEHHQIDETDPEEYSDSTTDSEPTCKELNKDVITSTPNQCSADGFLIETLKDKNKIIKIVISEDADSTAGSQSCSDDKTIVQDSVNELEGDVTQKAEMLKTRLQELQNEIEIFKRENEAVIKLKAELENEKEQFMKEKADIERKINEDKIIAEYYLAEEKEKLAKQKSLYDRHVREMKNHSTKKTSEEIALLKNEVLNLKDQIKLKDSKNGAAQARLRNQIKCLERDKEDFKLEIEKLKKENTRLQNANLRSKRLDNIKYLAEMNRTISKSIINDEKSDEFNYENNRLNKTVSAEYTDYKHSNKQSRDFDKPTVIKHNKPFKRTKSAPNLTSHYAKYFSKRDEDDKFEKEQSLGYGLATDSDQMSDVEDDFLEISKKDRNRSSRVYDYPKVKYDDRKEMSENDRSLKPTNYNEMGLKNHYDLIRNDDQSHSKDLNSSHYPKVKYDDRREMLEYDRSSKYNEIGLKNDYVPYGTIKNDDQSHSQGFNKEKAPTFDTVVDHVVINHEDGSKEVRFTNGNVKIVSADGSYSKFLYYNGDIKETFYNEGTIKYFYKEVSVHHTTYKDGSQLLQFPDGQVERRYPDGSVESQMSDGATRWTRAGGVQEWKFGDGTILIVSPTGDRTLRFPNGQVEVHTKEYKRREFPDGTVKIVYADGVVETRFANGRIRVKDKQDRVFLDSAGSHNARQANIS